MYPTRSKNIAARLASAEALMAAGEAFDTSIGGIDLRAYLFRTARASKGLALLLHGWTGDARAMAAFIGPLQAAGYDALAVDLPAHGASGGDETGAVEAAMAVKVLLERRGLRPAHVIAHSYGGAVAGMLADLGVTPKSVVSIAAPTRLDAIIEQISRGFGLSKSARTRLEALMSQQLDRAVEEFDAVKIWRNLPSDILVLHAPDDARVDFSHAEHLGALPNARLAPMPNLGHLDIVHHETSVRAALDHILSVDRLRPGLHAV